MPNYDGLALKKILEMESDGELLLPNFQRDFVWERSDQKQLIASYLIDIPIGSILLVEDKKGQYASRKLCFTENSSTIHKEEIQCQYLLDGQQRVSTLKSVFIDFWKEDWLQVLNKTYHKLRNRWFIKVKFEYDENDSNWLGLQWLKWDEAILKKCEPQDLIDQIHEEKIFETQTNKWFHPGFPEFYMSEKITPEESLEVEENHAAKQDILNQIISEKSVSDGLIPLYIVFDDNDDLLTQILNKIANKRADKLEALYKNNEKKLKYIFSDNRSIHKKLGDYDSGDSDIIQAWASLKAKWVEGVKTYLSSLKKQEIAVTTLDKSEINRAISVFEYMNKQGVTLDAFDLIVARAAVDNKHGISLREELVQNFNNEYKIPSKLKPPALKKLNEWHPTFFGIFEKDNINSSTQQVFINVLALNSYFNSSESIDKAYEGLKTEHIKSKTAIDLKSDEINSNFNPTLNGLKRAFAFFQFKLGCSKITDISYRLMLLPIAFFLQEDEIWSDEESLNKLEYWYWVSLLSDSFRDDKQQRVIDDIISLYEWLFEESNNPFNDRYKKVLAVDGWSDKNTLIQNDKNISAHSSIKNGLLSFILSQTPYDLLPISYKQKKLTTIDFTDLEIQDGEFNSFGYVHNIEKGKDILIRRNIHHIAPINSLNFWDKNDDDIRNNKDHKYNSPLNLTIISQISNNRIRDKKLNDYIKNIDSKSLQSHYINKEYLENIENDESYLRFLESRFNSIRGKVMSHLDDLVPSH
ncbi:DUF262 domain-containing protein [Balneola sp. MJW-20]|uniref:DUF262 domain-containing protein n=1 Tax=Gracilimonas aurantiaca TaxID=3234185 RepID=UPI0034669D87